MEVSLRRSHVFVFMFSIKGSALSPFFLQGVRAFTEASLGTEELQRFVIFRSCGSISEHSGNGSLLALA